MLSILHDLHYALRRLRKSPGFTFTAVAVLAFGLGANIAIFTVLNGILLRPLPYAQPDRIVEIKGTGTEQYYMMSYANMVQLRDSVGAKMRIGAVLNESMASVVGPGGRVQVHHVEVTASLFPMLGVQPLIGRAFRDEENDPGRNRVVLLGEDTWRKLYNADPQIAGKTLTIKEQAYTILGVMPRGLGAKRAANSTLPVPTRRRQAFSQVQPPCIAVETITAVGTARPMAQGQAITRTVTAEAENTFGSPATLPGRYPSP